MRIGILVTHIRPEEKLLIAAFQAAGVEPDILLDRDLNFDLIAGPEQLAPSGVPWADYALVLERAVSTSRGLYTLAILNAWGIPTINSSHTANTCADKLLTTVALARAGVPQPPARAAFDHRKRARRHRRLWAIRRCSSPSPARGGGCSPASTTATPPKPSSNTAKRSAATRTRRFTSQDYVEKPGRDIRAFVVGDRTICAIYRTSAPLDHQHGARRPSHAIARSRPNSTTLCQRAAREPWAAACWRSTCSKTPDGGLLVNEINHTMEFRNSSATDRRGHRGAKSCATR